MSTQKERRIVLDLLETGKINPGDAAQLLGAMQDSPRQGADDTVVFEIAADQGTLRQVVEKLNRAFSRP